MLTLSERLRSHHEGKNGYEYEAKEEFPEIIDIILSHPEWCRAAGFQSEQIAAVFDKSHFAEQIEDTYKMVTLLWPRARSNERAHFAVVSKLSAKSPLAPRWRFGCIGRESAGDSVASALQIKVHLRQAVGANLPLAGWI